MADRRDMCVENIAAVVAKTTKSRYCRQTMTNKESAKIEQRKMPKKWRQKTRELSSQAETNKNTTSDPLLKCVSDNPLAADNAKLFTMDEAPSERLRSLRNRRSGFSVKEEPEAGPSIKQEPLDYNSDHWGENLDDTDSDPAWTPSSKTPKNTESSKLLALPGRKRGPKPGRRSSSSGSRRRKSKKEKCPEKKLKKESLSSTIKEASVPMSRGRKDVVSDKFLIAKTDIHLKTPYIWKVDKKSSMLQRYEVSEQNGVLLYHSSFTYAAGNEISVNKYVTADVRIKSSNVVQYLGPNLSETAEVALSEMEPKPEKVDSPKDKFDYLKEDFRIYIQILLSQDVDSSFFSEIAKFNDDYFLIPIKNIEAVSEERKENVTKGIPDGEWKNCANTYPCVNILDHTSDPISCEVCNTNQGIRLLQFYGQPYDLTLRSVDTLPTTKTQFIACDICSISVSLYNRLHHHKYNLFVKCQSKANEVKQNNEGVQSHEDVLKLCLEDFEWLNNLFQEQIEDWTESDKVS